MTTSFLPRLLQASTFRSPLLRAIVPPVTAAFVIQAAVAVPSIAFQSERFYDFSGSLTFLAVGALSLYLPALRVRAAAAAVSAGGVAEKAALPSLLSAFSGGGSGGGWNWRQIVLTGAVALWAVRLGSYLFQRVLAEGKDSRFDEIKKSPGKFAVAFTGQAVWVSCCLLPVLLINGIPSAVLATAVSRVAATDVLGLGIWASGFAFEIAADRQKGKWLEGKRKKQHDEQFLTTGFWSLSRYPNYFGEISLWTGLATAAAGILARKPIQLALGLSGGPAGILATTAMSYASPAFAALLLLKVSGVPLSERKYDGKYGNRKDYQEWKKNTPMLIPKIW